MANIIQAVFDGINDYCQFSTAINFNIGIDPYVFEAKLTLRTAPTTYGGLLGRNGTATGFFIMPNGALAVYTTGTQRFVTNAGFFIVGENHTYRLEHDSNGDWRAKRDGSTIFTGNFNTSFNAANITLIGQGNNSGNSYVAMDLDYISLSGPVNGQKWNSQLSNGTGSVIPTESGSNQASMINFPTNGSQWLITTSGGTTYDGGSVTTFTLSTSGGGHAIRKDGSTTAFTLLSSGGGHTIRKGDGISAVIFAASGGGHTIRNGGSITGFTLSTLGSGTAIRNGGSVAPVTFNTTGSGRTIRKGGSVSVVTFTASGGGIIVGAPVIVTGGSTASVTIASSGGGYIIRNGGALASFTINATGSGNTVRKAGAVSSILVDSSGFGVTIRIGGSVSVVTFTASGGGIVVNNGEGHKQLLKAPTVTVKTKFITLVALTDKKRLVQSVMVRKINKAKACII